MSNQLLRMGMMGATTAILIASMVAVPAFAASPKFTKGSGIQNTSVSCTILDDYSLECTGEISGLGGSPTAALSATVEANFDCFNPAGQGPNPGHSGPVTVTGPSETLNVVNGKATFDLTIPAPSGPDAPNPGWTCQITSISYSNVAVIVDTVSGQFNLRIPGTFTA